VWMEGQYMCIFCIVIVVVGQCKLCCHKLKFDTAVAMRLCCTIDINENWLKCECLYDSQNSKDVRDKLQAMVPQFIWRD